MSLHIRALAVLVLTLVLTSVASGANLFPLEPPDTSSPRETLQSFLHYSEKYIKAMQAEEENPIELRESLERAARCFNLNAVPPTVRYGVGVESVLRLREILDRIELPDMSDVPDKSDVKLLDTVRWRIPHTEITIGKVPSGPRLGAFLFTPRTVEDLDEFYAEIRDFPYINDATPSIYEEYIYSSGWMVPDGFIGMLPDYMRQGYLGQAVWQWAGLILFLALGILLILLLYLLHRRLMEKFSNSAWGALRLFFPLSSMGICYFLVYLLNVQINITGRVLAITVMFLESALFLFAAWTIIIAGNLVTHIIISSQQIKEEALNADVIKLICRVISVGLIVILFYRAGGYFGLPVNAVFASAGVMGIAVAFAARETLSNFFGGISLFLDRPFRAGDYIVLESGERGEVKAVGMRSTRIQTRDDILLSIPNSVITNVKITNQSLPFLHSRVHIKVGVAYSADIDKVEEILLEVADNNASIMKKPAPRVRVRAFSDSSINVSLLVWAKRPHDRGRVTHELSKAVLNQFRAEGIEIPFPQRDIHIRSTSEAQEGLNK